MILFLVLLLLFNFQIESNDSIKKLQEKFENITNLEADFSQSSNGKSLMRGKFFFSQKNNYRIELKNNTIISDGKSIWNENKKREKVIISDINDDPLAFSLCDYIYNYPLKCKISEVKIGNKIILTLIPTSSQLNFKTAKLWINSKYLINKIEVFDFGGNSYLFEFRNIKINQSLSKRLFKFIDSGKLKIIDLR